MINNEENKFGKIIRDKRKILGMSCSSLSRITRISKSHIARVETQGGVSVDTAIILAEALDINKDYALSLIGQISPDVEDIILKIPVEMSELLRGIGHLTGSQISRLARVARESSKKSLTY